MTLPVAVALVLAAVGTYALTGWVRRYAVSRSMLDVPNARSSHTSPRPRGGGLAIAGVTVGGLVLGATLGWIPATTAVALGGGGIVIAAVGWVDDTRGLPALLRVVCHAGAATWALYWLGGLRHISFGSFSWSVGAPGAVLGVVGIAWAINAYNFMDGIDGLAASEAFVVGSIGGGLLLGAGEAGLAFVAFLIAITAAGFLPWNWQPARIFMGDVGSGLLGFYFASLAIASERSGSVPLVVWVILLGVFAFDAGLTLVRRVWRGERWYEAHRSHAYQRLVQAGWSHVKVGWVVGVVNLGLGALAWIGWRSREVLPAGLAASAVCLTALYLWVERISPMERLGTRPPEVQA